MASPRARQLRKTATRAEVRLWSHLRRKQLGGFRFRRQHPLGNYIVDFICAEARLIVEVDGGQHSEHNLHDATRTEWLQARSYRVIRFWNSAVLSQTEDVLAAILEALRARPPSLPSPSRGEGEIR